MMSILLLLLPIAVFSQWGQQIPPGLPQQGQFNGQYSFMAGYPQSTQGNSFGVDMYNNQPFGGNSRLGSPVIRPGMMGYGYPSQMSSQMGPYSPQMGSFPSEYPMMFGAPTSMGFGQFSRFSSQTLPPMSSFQSRSFGQFQADSTNRDVEKPISSLQPTRVIPPFMKTATPQQLDQFYSIVQNPVWSPLEKQQKIEEFIRSMDTNTQNIFASYSRATQSESETKRQKVHKLVDSMTPEAQVQFQKVSALMTNPAINETERLQKIQDIYSKIPDSIKKEFDEKLTNL